MHPKNDPKSDQVCCLQSSGLCHNVGSKHHRSNKKCWLFPGICEHCDAVRVASSKDTKQRALEGSGGYVSYEKIFFEAQPPLSDPTVITNDAIVQHNNRIDASTTREAIDGRSPREVATQAANEAVRGISISLQYRKQLAKSIEKQLPLSLPQTPPATPPAWISKRDDLMDLGQRIIRSQAPSPESLRSQEQRSRIPVGVSSHTMWQLEVDNSREAPKRDPRLALNFVLEAI